MSNLTAFMWGVLACLLAIFAATKIHPAIYGEFDALYHTEWKCSDARIDGLALPLKPVCWEYQRKDAAK